MNNEPTKKGQRSDTVREKTHTLADPPETVNGEMFSQDLDETLQVLVDGTQERPIQEDLHNTLERKTDKDVQALQSITQRLSQNSTAFLKKAASLQMPERPEDLEYSKLRELNQQLLSELGKNVDYVEKLSTIAVHKAYKETEQRRAKKRYFRAMILVAAVATGFVGYLKYGLSAEQKKYFQTLWENKVLAKKVEESEQKISQKTEEIQEKEKALVAKTEEIQEKEKDLTVARQNVGEKEQVITKTQEALTQAESQLSKTKTELTAKSYVTTKLAALQEAGAKIQVATAAFQKWAHDLETGEMALRTRHGRLENLFQEILENKKIWEALQIAAEEKLLVARATLYDLDQTYLHELDTLKRLCLQREKALVELGKLTEQKQPELLQYSDKHISEIGKIEKEIMDWETAWQQLQTQAHSDLEQVSARFQQFQIGQQTAYARLFEFYQKHHANNKTFGMIYQNLQGVHGLGQETAALWEKLAPAGQDKLRATHDNLAKTRQQHAAATQEFATLYQKFLQLVAEISWIKEVENFQHSRQSDSILTSLRKADQDIDGLLDQAQRLHQKIVKASKYYLATRELLAQESLVSKESAPKIPATTKTPETTQTEEKKPLTTPATSVKSLDVTQERARLVAMYDQVKSSFQMTGAEFVMTTRLFVKNKDKLQLQNYVISRLVAETYRQESGDIPCLLIQALAPQDQLGNRILKRGDQSWLYEERPNSLVRMTPQVLRLTPGYQFHQVIVIADLTMNNLRDYELQSAQELVSEKGDKFCRLQLTSAVVKEMPTLKVVYSLTQALPVKLEYCNTKPLVTVYCRTFQTTALGKRVTKYIVVDAQTPDVLLEVEYLNIAKKQFPEYMFQKEYLSRMK